MRFTPASEFVCTRSNVVPFPITLASHLGKTLANRKTEHCYRYTQEPYDPFIIVGTAGLFPFLLGRA